MIYRGKTIIMIMNMVVGMRLEKLASFIKTLEDLGIYKFNIDEFDNRLMLQKLVYISKFFGIDLGYSFNYYLRGPYSPELADDYFRLAELDWNALREKIPKITTPEFEKFVNFVRGKDIELLEGIATGLVFCKKLKIMNYPYSKIRKLLPKLIASRKPFLEDRSEEITEIILSEPNFA